MKNVKFTVQKSTSINSNLALGKVVLTNLLALEGPSTSAHANLAWIDMVGGIDMLLCTSRTEMLSAALIAPSDLLFGLAYGKISDTLFMRHAQPCPSHPVVFAPGPRSEEENRLLKRVTARACALDRLAQTADASFYSVMTYKMSSESLEVLDAQIARATHPFLLGQLQSWRSTHLRTLTRPINTLVIG